MSISNSPTQEMIDQFVGNAHGNFAFVKEMVEKFPSIVSANATWTETAVQAATQTGQVEIVNYLVDHGAEYDICTAAMLGNLDCVKDFLAEDTDLINARGAHGFPLLYFPTIRTKLAVAEYLLQHGANPNTASADGLTPLHGAVMFNQLKMAQWLLEHGANPNNSYNEKTPLAMARDKNLTELAEIIHSYGGKE
jgi:ankyrin repeat protein